VTVTGASGPAPVGAADDDTAGAPAADEPAAGSARPPDEPEEPAEPHAASATDAANATSVIAVGTGRDLIDAIGRPYPLGPPAKAGSGRRQCRLRPPAKVGSGRRAYRLGRPALRFAG
jgi:hypothetical protein